MTTWPYDNMPKVTTKSLVISNLYLSSAMVDIAGMKSDLLSAHCSAHFSLKIGPCHAYS